MSVFDDEDNDDGLNGTFDRMKKRAGIGSSGGSTPSTPSSGSGNNKTFFERHIGLCIGGVIALCVILLIGWSMCTTIVPAGSVGVQDRFGEVQTNILNPGLHVKDPFTDIIPMSTRTSVYNAEGNQISTFSVLSHDGVPVSIGIAVNYHIDPAYTADLYKTVGANYENIIMLNPIHTVPRDVIAQYDTQALFTASQSENDPTRIKITEDIFKGISKEVKDPVTGNSRGIVIEQIYLRNIVLPDAYTNSATQKKVMEQQIQTAEFEVQKVQMEAQSQVAKAQGEANANEILTKSLSNELLRYTWIQSMKDNPKVIYVPIGTDGQPNFNLMKTVSDGSS